MKVPLHEANVQPVIIPGGCMYMYVPVAAGAGTWYIHKRDGIFKNSLVHAWGTHVHVYAIWLEVFVRSELLRSKISRKFFSQIAASPVIDHTYNI